MERKADQVLFEAIASIIGATNCFLSKSDLRHFLVEATGTVPCDTSALTAEYMFAVKHADGTAAAIQAFRRWSDVML